MNVVIGFPAFCFSTQLQSSAVALFYCTLVFFAYTDWILNNVSLSS